MKFNVETTREEIFTVTSYFSSTNNLEAVGKRETIAIRINKDLFIINSEGKGMASSPEINNVVIFPTYFYW